MPKIEFVSHESFPEDQYTKELVYLCLDEKYRIAYVRKPGKNGGLFWSVPSIAITKNGQKSYFEGFLQDSSFLEKDIKNFLENRLWVKTALTQNSVASTPAVDVQEDLPF